ncbi:DUF6456 domain-containing protein [Roseomonas sp. BN140053]|uniref:DUF6456 domain-containing protein n=1 Tax=Roseomonas sp. BN140053 TaxID=3391898 RepID=UPI0039E7FB2D
MVELEKPESRVIASVLAPEFRAARVEREAAAIERARRVAPLEGHPEHKIEELRRGDQGPVHQRNRRRLEVVDATDPVAGVPIRRARLRDPMRRLVLRDHWPYRLYVAAATFRDDCEVAAGGGAGSLADALDKARLGLPIVTTSLPWQRSNAEAPGQIAAQQRLKEAWRVVGIVAGGVFSWVVVSNGSLADYDECKGLRKGEGGKTLKAALERLADFYDVGDVEMPPKWD